MCTQHRVAGSVHRAGFTLIELLTVVAIISMLMTILMPSLSRARAQAKAVVCQARLRDMGTGLAMYANEENTLPAVRYEVQSGLYHGLAELMFGRVVTGSNIDRTAGEHFPVQRNIVHGYTKRYLEYFNCVEASPNNDHMGHYRPYSPAWCYGSYSVTAGGSWNTAASPVNIDAPAGLDRVPYNLPLLADANPECTEDVTKNWIGPAEVMEPDDAGANRIDTRHYGGANFLFPDSHVERRTTLREELATDYDLNGDDDS